MTIYDTYLARNDDDDVSTLELDDVFHHSLFATNDDSQSVSLMSAVLVGEAALLRVLKEE